MKTLKKIMIVLSIIAVIHFSTTTFLNENRTIAREIVGNKYSYQLISAENNIDSLLLFFHQTTYTLKKAVSGLSHAQLQFSPSEEKWSISQCLEHIILSEKMLFEMAKKELEKPTQPNRRTDVQQTDENLINSIVDRSQKFQAPKELQPSGKYKSSDVAMMDFVAARQPVLTYIQHADIDNLRNHVSDYPTGTVDGYQNLLFIAAHCARHIKQIEEVKADPNFPKE
jgi:hypothetical protein